MRFGVNIINFGERATPEHLTRWATFAEDLGFDFAMSSDHVAMTDDVVARYPTPFYEPLATIAYLAGVTTRLRLGTTVLILPYRHPLLTARMLANLHELSGGRMILGVGVGWAKEEFSALGAEFARRGADSDAQLATITGAWSKPTVAITGAADEPLTAHTGPRPPGPGAIPIWVGGHSDAALERAVRFGDAWHPIEPGVGEIERVGAPRLAKVAEQLGMQPPPIAPRIHLEVTDSALTDDARVTGKGSIDQIRADLASLERLGVVDVLFDTAGRRDVDIDWHWRQLELVASAIVDLDRGEPR